MDLFSGVSSQDPHLSTSYQIRIRFCFIFLVIEILDNHHFFNPALVLRRKKPKLFYNTVIHPW